jgi:hypothetical protein
MAIVLAAGGRFVSDDLQQRCVGQTAAVNDGPPASYSCVSAGQQTDTRLLRSVRIRFAFTAKQRPFFALLAIRESADSNLPGRSINDLQLAALFDAVDRCRIRESDGLCRFRLLGIGCAGCQRKRHKHDAHSHRKSFVTRGKKRALHVSSDL